jgi:hypothetical protein
MSRHIHLMPDRRLPMRDIAEEAPQGVDTNPAHLLSPRKALFKQRPARNFPVSVVGQRSCNCSTLLVRFLIWATRNTSHSDG